MLELIIRPVYNCMTNDSIHVGCIIEKGALDTSEGMERIGDDELTTSTSITRATPALYTNRNRPVTVGLS